MEERLGVVNPPQAPANEPEIAVFRPSLVLRYAFAVAGIGCAIIAMAEWRQAVVLGEGFRLFGGLLLAVPCIVAFAVTRKRVQVEPSGLKSVTLFSSRLIPWTRVVRLDQTRKSFVVESELGPVSAGWLAEGDRERLLKLVLQHARLMATKQNLRWGIKMRYVPRTQSISLVNRREAAKDDRR